MARPLTTAELDVHLDAIYVKLGEPLEHIGKVGTETQSRHRVVTCIAAGSTSTPTSELQAPMTHYFQTKQ